MASTKTFFGTLAEGVAGLLRAKGSTCVFCGREKRESEIDVCEVCVSTWIKNNGKTCLRCGCQITTDNRFCGICTKQELFFAQIVSSFVFGKQIATAVYKLKFGGKDFVAEEMAKFLHQTFLGLDWEIDVVVAVPMHKKSIEKRGFNQSEVLAKFFCEFAHLNIDLTNLVKSKYTHTQEGLSYKQRMENLSGAFEIVKAKAFAGKNVLVIDDVKTTSATINELAKLLKKSGAKQVFGLTFASQHKNATLE